jgi:DNA-binding Lrp family transcriptional regulator
MKDSSTRPLDRTDVKILRALQADGRLTNAELAARVNVSSATCHRRTQRLFDAGYITGVRAEVAPAAVGLGALVMVGVVLDRSTPESFAAFEGAVLGIKDVLDCHLGGGRLRLPAEDPRPRHGGFQQAARPEADRASGRPADADVLRDEGGEGEREVAVLMTRDRDPMMRCSQDAA